MWKGDIYIIFNSHKNTEKSHTHQLCISKLSICNSVLLDVINGTWFVEDKVFPWLLVNIFSLKDFFPHLSLHQIWYFVLTGEFNFKWSIQDLHTLSCGKCFRSGMEIWQLGRHIHREDYGRAILKTSFFVWNFITK